MIIKAGTHEIKADAIMQEKRTVEDEQRDAIRIVLTAGLTDAQLEALKTHTLDIDDGYKTYEGYTHLLEHYLVMTKGADGLLQEARQAAAQAQAAQAQAEEAAAQKELLLETMADALPPELAVQHPDLYKPLEKSGKEVLAGKRVRWGDQIAVAKVTLWDREDQDPDHAPELWDILKIGEEGYRVIPNPIPATETFKPGEIGKWTDGKLYKSVHPTPHAWTPADYPAAWEVN